MEENQLISSGIHDLQQVAKQILSEMKDERIFTLYGKMGAGKTTLIKAFCQVLGVKDVASSPTFAIVNEYSGDQLQPVFHFDFYRIKKIEEVFDIGYEEYLYSGYYCFIEWPELISNLLPDDYVQIIIDIRDDEAREITYGLHRKGNSPVP
ncbi:MAG TPA: tRNA (adenosine(37)-N6)-threonylcarbamoyltransferase complex ATPase subunit type 1 TsaE [Bacteroidetes bacterium]|nr:tRNA (adenosine(37)-N6)-threonylcarbamoyltransferase complex ATPase subunit type 1 TsaE [Bacteroidota bacterium]